jgi:hypothetical protein
MRGAITPLPRYIFMAWCLVKHRDKFTFTFNFTYFLDQNIFLSTLFWHSLNVCSSLRVTDNARNFSLEIRVNRNESSYFGLQLLSTHTKTVAWNPMTVKKTPLGDLTYSTKRRGWEDRSYPTESNHTTQQEEKTKWHNICYDVISWLTYIKTIILCTISCKGKKVKVKLSLCHGGILEDWTYSSTHSLTSALDGVGGQLYSQGTLPPGKEPLVPTGYDVGWAPETVWKGW